MTSERRSGPRIPLQVWVSSAGEAEVRRWLGESVTPPDFAFCYATRDVGERGLFLESEDPLALGAVLQLELPLPGREEPVRLLGRVARVVPRGDPSHPVPGMGIELVEVTAEARALLAAFVEEAKRV